MRTADQMEAKLDVQEVIARFANSFDWKDWDGLQSCFTETLFTDYSDLRGTPPQMIGDDEYVAARRQALDSLQLHHLAGNYEVAFQDENRAFCRASMVIWRKSDVEEFTSHCIYEFQLLNDGAGWKISGITQKIMWNEGSSSIHKGAKG